MAASGDFLMAADTGGPPLVSDTQIDRRPYRARLARRELAGWSATREA
jgi:hypothetical protein